jgi:hypothetical protein
MLIGYICSIYLLEVKFINSAEESKSTKDCCPFSIDALMINLPPRLFLAADWFDR